jgi:hypothetical protein
VGVAIEKEEHSLREHCSLSRANPKDRISLEGMEKESLINSKTARIGERTAKGTRARTIVKVILARQDDTVLFPGTGWRLNFPGVD